MCTLTFKQLQKVIGCAGDKKLTEVRLCLEGMSLDVPESLDQVLITLTSVKYILIYYVMVGMVAL